MPHRRKWFIALLFAVLTANVLIFAVLADTRTQKVGDYPYLSGAITAQTAATWTNTAINTATPTKTATSTATPTRTATNTPTPTATSDTPPAIPAAPELLSPSNPTITNQNNFPLVWNVTQNADYYKLQVSKDPEFVTLLVKSGKVYELTYDLPKVFDKDVIPDGTYYWRVRAFNVYGVKSQWSKVWKFKVDTKPPAIPVLYRPANNASKSDLTPKLSIYAAAGAKYYQYQVAADDEFINVAADSGKWAGTSWTVPDDKALKYGGYYWRVKSIDAAANESVGWSSVRKLTITIQKLPGDGAVTTDKTPTFEWEAVTGADHYQLFIASTDPSTGEPESFYYERNGLIGSTFTLLKEDKLPAGRYWWRMRIFFDEDEADHQTTSWRLLEVTP